MGKTIKIGVNFTPSELKKLIKIGQFYVYVKKYPKLLHKDKKTLKMATVVKRLIDEKLFEIRDIDVQSYIIQIKPKIQNTLPDLIEDNKIQQLAKFKKRIKIK